MNVGIFCAITSALGYSLRTLFVKKVTGRGFTINTIQFYYRFVSIIISLLSILIFKETLFLDLDLKFVLVMLGLVTLGYAADMLYYKALKNLDVGIVALLGRTTPIISLIVSYVFLRELPNSIAVLGVLIIVVASAWLMKNLKKEGEKKKSKKHVMYLFAGMILYTLVSTWGNNVTKEIGVMNFLLYYSIAACTTFLVGALKEKGFRSAKNTDLKDWLLVLVYIVSAYVPFLTSTIAYKILMVSIAYALTSFSLLFSLTWGYIFFKEKDNLLKKILAGIVMLLGGWLAVQ